jgi:8-oxo-dGTP diphosphatase
MTKYVLGFSFSEDHEHVLLIKKDHPEWQKGKFNGVGGKLNEQDEYENAYEAMVREFSEETGLQTTPQDWEIFCTMKGEDWFVYCLHSYSDDIHNAKQLESEEPIVVPVKEISQLATSDGCIPNLAWLIPMALINDHIDASVAYQAYS